MADLLGGSSTIRTSISADTLDAKTDVTHQQDQENDDDSKNNGSIRVTLTTPRVGRSKVATTTPKMRILFNQSEDIKVGYFRKFEFVDIQRAHSDTFDDYHMIFLANPIKQYKTPEQKELYAFYEI